uniref:2-amino-4-hydroxy-6-hydroxymethyldihydropteridine diphosphokinase n=1 Tax=Paulinella longichromatophora TaxID=1708747 RepID=A0A2H4ZPM2_9EUKA|nr:putative 2-amino-4-hydroxy-6- hydroxymethyldihydropteridinepyrophosphokinase [Paulinella longichromatophora]
MSSSTTLTLGIALGANLNDPLSTLRGLRSLLILELKSWSSSNFSIQLGEGDIYWSPLFYTSPIKGSPIQEPYINSVLVLILAVPFTPLCIQLCQAQSLLNRLHKLEDLFGRHRIEHWGSRTLDLDLLWYGSLRFKSVNMTLPHPDLLERSFVLGPLAMIFPSIMLSTEDQRLSGLLSKILIIPLETVPKALNNSLIWPDSV